MASSAALNALTTAARLPRLPLAPIACNAVTSAVAELAGTPPRAPLNADVCAGVGAPPSTPPSACEIDCDTTTEPPAGLVRRVPPAGAPAKTARADEIPRWKAGGIGRDEAAPAMPKPLGRPSGATAPPTPEPAPSGEPKSVCAVATVEAVARSARAAKIFL